MHVVKKTYETIIKTINWCNICMNCNKTEKDLVGVSINTIKNINIFSVEGLCIDCEIRSFPERFHGCGFCKRPIREKFCCTTCSNGFIEWVNYSIHPMDSFSEIIKRSAPELVNRSIYDMPELVNTKFILRTDDGYYKWPGFYAGITNRFSKESKTKINNIPTKLKTNYDTYCNYDSVTNDDKYNMNRKIKQMENNQSIENFIPIWIIPRMLNQPCFNISDIKLEITIFQQWLLRILESNNIYLYSDVQIDADMINLEQVVKVNPFDTRIFKRI
jgi:hypothetical protein